MDGFFSPHSPIGIGRTISDREVPFSRQSLEVVNHLGAKVIATAFFLLAKRFFTSRILENHIPPS
jgi:hypothetical protein